MSYASHYRVRNDLQTKVMKDTKDLESGRYLENLQEKLKIKILFLKDDEIVFDLIGVDAPIANALRRILLAEVPTIAIETIWMSVNTSIIQDEVLSHRLGLIPICVDPTQFIYRQGEDETDSDTVIFNLVVSCEEPNPPVENFSVYVLSKHLVWQPQGNQLERFPDGIAPVHDDIIIAQLRPGQSIELEAHAHKGMGKDHTKFSPVATASYRLLPDITFNEPITGQNAYELRDMCPMNVFDIEDICGKKTAVVSRPRDCTMCRECIRKDGWQDKVILKRVADHYIFTVESTGSIQSPIEIVKQAFLVLKEKALKFQGYVEEYENTR